MTQPSRIFRSYRALGYVSGEVPLAIRYIQRRQEHLITTVIGPTFLTYGSRKLRLLNTSPPLPDNITYLATDDKYLYTASGKVVKAWVKGCEAVHKYEGHDKLVHLLLAFKPHIISVDTDSTLKIWEIESEELYLELNFSNESFRITALVHPATYLNKILIGSSQGSMQLWNLKTSKLIYTFAGWKSSITILEQAPAVDVIGIGLEDGRIILHNLKYDKTLMKFKQDWGPVSSLSFRTDGPPLLASGSTTGCIALWNLEDKVLHSQIQNAHQGPVAGMKFLQNEPLMITNSVDNSLKTWIFDLTDGGGRLLRYRDGHAAPPTKIAFYGTSGENILSAGEDSTLRVFHVINDSLHHSMGCAYYNRKAAKRAINKNEVVKMAPIIDFSAEPSREQEWDNIVACHRGMTVVSTWSYGRKTMGKYKLKRALDEDNLGVPLPIAQCAVISVCGNYAIIGFDSGHVDKFNIQSGIYRGSYGNPKAHEKSVCGLVTDILNLMLVTTGTDKCIKFWGFKSRELTHVVNLDHIVSRMLLHRESGLLALSSEDFSLQLLDLDTKRIVRVFEGHVGRITSFDFRADSRWLISASQDCSIRTWDIPAARLIDCFLVEDVCTCLSMSPTGEFLATIHVDNLGVYLWINCSLYIHVSFVALPPDFEPQIQQLPSIHICRHEDSEGEIDRDLLEESSFKSPEQISNELVTLSLLPDSRWKNLLVLDVIKKRNKPKEPPKVPKAAPFFLPTVPGLKFQFDIPDEEASKKKDSKVATRQSFRMRTEFSDKLENAKDATGYFAAMDILKSLGPSAIDVEIQSLTIEAGGSDELLLDFMTMINHVFQTNRDFEVAQAYLGLFLKVNGKAIASNATLQNYAETLLENQTKTWERLQTMYGKCQCLISFLKSAPL